MIESFPIRLSVDCQACQTSIPVNGVVESVRCYHCGETNPLGQPFWTWALSPECFAEALTFEPGNATEHKVMGRRSHRLAYGRRIPRCQVCTGPDLDERVVVSAAAAGQCACTGCGAGIRVRDADALCRAIHPNARYMVGETADDAAAQALQKQTSPVMFACMGCGAGLRIDGTSRAITCTFCNASNYLPDGVWQQFHPVPKPQTFFFLCEFDAAARDQLARQAALPALTSARDVVTDLQGNLYVMTFSDGVQSVDGELRPRWKRAVSVQGRSLDQLAIIVGRLVVYDDDGTTTRTLALADGSDAQPFTLPEKVEFLVGMRDGTAVARVSRRDSSGSSGLPTLVRFDSSGARVPFSARERERTSSMVYVHHVAALPDGGLAISDTAAGWTCRVLDASGHERSATSFSFGGQYPGNLVADAHGQVLVAVKGLVWLLAPGPAREFCRVPIAISKLASATGGGLWVFADDGARRFDAAGQLVFADPGVAAAEEQRRRGQRDDGSPADLWPTVMHKAGLTGVAQRNIIVIIGVIVALIFIVGMGIGFVPMLIDLVSSFVSDGSGPPRAVPTVTAPPRQPAPVRTTPRK
jgi:hypothetical protein